MPTLIVSHVRRALIVAGLAIASRAGAQAALPRRADVSFRPATLSQGRLVEVLIRGSATSSAPSGTLAGLPLHFERRDSRWWALGALAVDAPDTVALVLRGDSGDSAVHRIAVRQVPWPTERLRVAPRFGQEPDSALSARLERESARAQEIGRQSHETPRLWRTGFARPRPGRVTSGFGKAREYNGQVQGRHNGTDFAGATGSPVRATNRGVVALVDTFYLGGRVISLDHGAGLVTAYMHLSRADVAAGDTVQRGEIIGRVGATGRVTGPHLHWIVRYGGVTVDALSLPGLAPAATPSRRPRR